MNDKAPDKGGDGKTNPPPAPPPADDDRPGLGKLERSGALIVGLAGVGTGGVGVFLSDNQAGTTAILLLGAVFLLMGVQGTAIRSASRDNVEMERRAKAKATKAIVQEAERALEDGEPERAAVINEVAERVSSNYNYALSDMSGRIYETMLGAALLEYAAGKPDFEVVTEYFDIMPDFRLVNTATGFTLNIDAKFLSNPDSGLTRSFMQKNFNRWIQFNGPMVVITNAVITPNEAAKVLHQTNRGLHLVRWQGSKDNSELFHSLDSIIGELSQAES